MKTYLLKCAMLCLACICIALSLHAQPCEKWAKQEAKTWEKKGYYAPIGSKAMCLAISDLVTYRDSKTTDNESLYFMGAAEATAHTKASAQKQAVIAATILIAGQIEIDINAISKNIIGSQKNITLTKKEEVTITSTLEASQSYISQNLKAAQIVFEAYKDEPQIGQFTDAVQIAYKRQDVTAAAIKTVMDNLPKEAEELQKKLENILAEMLKK